jgi:hypothetical protein
MDTFAIFFLNDRINLIPLVFWWLMFAVSALLLFLLRREHISKALKSALKISVGAAVFFRVFWAALLSYGQYYVWSQNDFGRLLLTTPLPQEASTPAYETLFPFLFTWDKGYYVHYIFGRFWVEALLSVLAALAFYGLLAVFRKYKDRFFREGEVLLGFLCALIVGWPMTAVFIGGVGVFAVLFSVARYALKHELYTTLGAPFVASAAACLLFAQFILKLTPLSVLLM